MSKFLEVAIDIAHEAGALLEHHFLDRVRFELKGENDLVTVADRASEKLIVERLTAHFADHNIMAEEGGGSEKGSPYRWYVDPLDGTTNFAHGYPQYNVTLALERGGEMIAGVVYRPHVNELFAAELGSGAYLNGRRIHVSKAPVLSESLVCTGFPVRFRNVSVNIHFYHHMALTTHGVRRSGSAAIDLSDVACGRLESFWEFGLSPWDLAAGKILITEAGGTVTDMKGDPHTMASGTIACSNGLIHAEMLEEFAEVFAGKSRFPMPAMGGQ